jgi:hypothetical protein
MEICKTQPPRELNLAGHVVHCHAVEQPLVPDDGDHAAHT